MGEKEVVAELDDLMSKEGFTGSVDSGVVQSSVIGKFAPRTKKGTKVETLRARRNVHDLLDYVFDFLDCGPRADSYGSFALLTISYILDEKF